MNITGNLTAQCLQVQPQTPFGVHSAWCAIPVGNNTNLSLEFQACCNSTPAYYNYSPPNPRNCWQYCNFTTSPTLNNLTIMECMQRSSDFPLPKPITCGPATSNTSSHVFGSRLTWLLLGLIITGTVL
jgi:hypothetical protein